jgi:hypothetical protein
MNFEHELLSFLMKFQVVEENVTIKKALSLSCDLKKAT